MVQVLYVRNNQKETQAHKQPVITHKPVYMYGLNFSYGIYMLNNFSLFSLFPDIAVPLNILKHFGFFKKLRLCQLGSGEVWTGCSCKITPPIPPLYQLCILTHQPFYIADMLYFILKVMQENAVLTYYNVIFYYFIHLSNTTLHLYYPKGVMFYFLIQ